MTTRVIIDAPPKTSGCMRFSPRLPGGLICKCTHSFYSHYQCGAPDETRCLACVPKKEASDKEPDQC